jgi:glycosyltransferase involved in cell wall biosynthesis
MPPTPDVSVAIPVFDGADHLAEALDSVLSQSAALSEVRVLDNASTDGSVQIARSRIPDEAVVLSGENKGAAHNFNRAARTATGEYFAWVAADDRLHPRFVERCLSVLDEQPEAPACLTGIRFIGPDGSPHRLQTDLLLASGEPGVRLRSFLRRRRWTEFYCLYRRGRLLESPLVLPEYGADVLLTWWFLLRGPLAVTPEILLDYREYPAKTVAQTAHALDPHAPVVHWRKQVLWRRLRAMTYEAGVSPHVGRVARRELLLVIAHHAWWIHLAEDVWERWPRLERVARWCWNRLGQPGRLAPRSDAGAAEQRLA